MLRAAAKNAACLVALAAGAAACVTAHPAEFAAKKWGCPESKISTKDARATGSGRAYTVTGCGKQMVVECIYRDDAPDAPYECTSRDETNMAAAAPSSSSSAPPRSVASAPSSVPATASSPLAATSAPATMVTPVAVDLGAVSHFVATDGRGFAMSDRDAKSEALAASGAFDLSCAKVLPRVMASDHGAPLYFAEGCARRATYVIGRSEGPPEVDSFVLIGVVPITPK